MPGIHSSLPAVQLAAFWPPKAPAMLSGIKVSISLVLFSLCVLCVCGSGCVFGIDLIRKPFRSARNTNTKISLANIENSVIWSIATSTTYNTNWIRSLQIPLFHCAFNRKNNIDKTALSFAWIQFSQLNLVGLPSTSCGIVLLFKKLYVGVMLIRWV